MTSLNRFKAPLALAVALALPLITNGCSSVTDAQAAVCCTEFKAGAAVDAKIGGSVQAQVAVQAVADIAGVASASIADITTACRGIATDLGAPAADLDKAEKTTGSDPDDTAKKKMTAYCTAAISALGTIKATAGGQLNVVVVPPKCEASLSAKANCEASCNGGVKCDFKAHPPMCTGGSLQVACKGECKAKAGVDLKCTGSCTGECKGSCTVKTGGVECSGKCNGTCKASAMGGTGTGIQADGSCKGSCEGTCEATAPSAKCSGSCSGTCTASCMGSAEASVQCDGECAAEFEPLKCEGGKLEGGCNAEVKCSGNCDASVQAKAECTPPSVSVEFSGAADIGAAGKIQATLEANLPLVFAIKARIEALATIAGSFSANINADVVGDIKASCIPILLATLVSAGGNITAAGSATVDLVGAAK